MKSVDKKIHKLTLHVIILCAHTNIRINKCERLNYKSN